MTFLGTVQEEEQHPARHPPSEPVPRACFCASDQPAWEHLLPWGQAIKQICVPILDEKATRCLKHLVCLGVSFTCTQATSNEMVQGDDHLLVEDESVLRRPAWR